jgi:hypothetical protein
MQTCKVTIGSLLCVSLLMSSCGGGGGTASTANPTYTPKPQSRDHHDLAEQCRRRW